MRIQINTLVWQCRQGPPLEMQQGQCRETRLQLELGARRAVLALNHKQMFSCSNILQAKSGCYWSDIVTQQSRRLSRSQYHLVHIQHVANTATLPILFLCHIVPIQYIFLAMAVTHVQLSWSKSCLSQAWLTWLLTASVASFFEGQANAG